MKKITKLSLLLTTLFFATLFVNTANSQACDHTFNMIDTYGDGWNGNSVSVFVNGQEVATDQTFSSGASGVFTFDASTTDAITLTWTQGSYPGEVEWNIVGGDDSVVGNGVFGATSGGAAACPPVAGACNAPNALTPLNLTSSSADLQWTDVNDAGISTSFDLAYTDSSGTTTTVPGVTSPYSLTGLSANALYTFNVTAICNSGSTTSSDATFTTLCDANSTFPYLESFETITTGQPDCWSLEGTTTTASYHFSSFATGQTGRGMRFDSYLNSTNRTSELMTPVMDASALTTLELNFQFKNPTGGNFEVSVSSDGGSTYTSLETGLTAQTDWVSKNYVLTSYISSNMLVKFKGTSNYGSGDANIYLDEVGIREIPSCLEPTALSATASSATEATLSWTAGDSETAWEYVIQASGTGEPAGSGTATTTNPLSLSGLTSNTDYEIYLRADCGGDYSPWVRTTFITTAGCGDSISITYENSFNGLVYSFSAPSGQYTSVTAGGQTEGCCDSMWITDGSGNALYGSQASPIGGSLSGTYESTDGTILIYLVSDGSVSDTMTFAFLCYDPPATAPDCATNFTNTVDANCGNEDFIVSWDTVDGAGGYLITAGTTSGGNDLADAVDLDLNATSYAFIAVPGQSYYYIVTPYNLNGNAEGCVEQIITLSSSICTPCDSAVALTPGTQQSGNTIDFGDTFDDSICLGNYSSGDDAIYSYLATEDGETMTVTVDFTSTWGGVAMSLGCPSGDSTAYTCVGSATGSASGVKSFTSDALIAGETYYIHISTYATPQSTVYTLDTVVIAAPACVDPIALEAASITTDSADISWTSGDSSFNIEVVDVTGGGSATGIATYSGVSSPYALTGLLDNNAYIVYVQTDCGADLSEWVSTGFTTLPLPIIPDYTNDFSIFPGDLWSTGSPTGSFSSPWEADGFANDGTTGAAKSNIYFRNNIQVLESPIFDLSGGTYYLNLLAAVTAWNSTNALAMGSDDSVSVSVSVDGGNYVILHTWNESNNPGPTGTNMPEVDLTAYSSANVRFAITMNDGFIDDNEDYDFFIDDFQITTTSSLGIQEVSILQFKYFPSPVNDQLTINAQTNVDNIVVLNMLGQVVSSQSPNSLNCLVDMAAMKTGVYFVQVSIGNETETVRVLKQ
jgi:hypothetical protein